MANIYVRSSDGNNADSGATWALAKANIAGASAIDAAGDTIWISQAHSETNVGNTNAALAGIDTSIEYVLCGNDSAEPPTSLATTAVITTQNGGNMSWQGAAYIYGIVHQVGTGANNAGVLLGNANARQQRIEQCEFRLNCTLAGPAIVFNSSGAANNRQSMINCRYRFSNAGQGFQCGGMLHEYGGSFVSGGTAPTTLIKALNTGIVLFEGTDFTNLGTSFNVTIPPISGLVFNLRRIKFASGWSGNLISASIAAPARVSMYNYMIGTTEFMLWIEDFAGVIKSETTIVMTNGASDGTTAFSWKMTTNSNAESLITHLRSDEMVVWTDAVGGSPDIQKTITVNILHDSATNLTDDEVWLEVQYLSSNSSPLGSHITDRKADTLATAADQTASSEAWTTTGMANPNKQKLSVTVTPGQKGFYVCRVVLAKASKTIYVDPAPVLS